MLNALQKQILEKSLRFIFDGLVDEIPYEIALKALDALTDETCYKKHKTDFEKHAILACVDQARKIIQYPCPQNRSTGSPYVTPEPNCVVYEPNGHGSGLARERQGLLGLTAFHDGYFLNLIHKEGAFSQEKRAIHFIKNNSIAIVVNSKGERKKIDLKKLPDATKYLKLPLPWKINKENLHVTDDHVETVIAWVTQHCEHTQEDRGCPRVTRQDVIDYFFEQKKQYQQMLYQAQSESVLSKALSRPRSSMINTTQDTASFIFSEAVQLLISSLKEEIKDLEGLNAQAPITYTTSLLSVIKRQQLDELDKRPGDFSIPPKLLPFIKLYLKEHPILLSARQKETEVSRLQSAYLSAINNPNSTMLPAPLSCSEQTIWSNSTIEVQTFRQAALDFRVALEKLLQPFSYLEPSAASTYSSTFLGVLRRGDMETFLKRPEHFSIPGEIVMQLVALAKNYPTLTQAPRFANECQSIELAFKKNDLSSLRSTIHDENPITIQQNR